MPDLHALGFYVRRDPTRTNPTLQVRAFAVGRSFQAQSSITTPPNSWARTTIAALHNGSSATLDTSDFVNWVARAGGVPRIGTPSEPLRVCFHWFADLGEPVVFPGPFASQVELTSQLIAPPPGRFFMLLLNDTATDPVTKVHMPYRDIPHSSSFQAAAEKWKAQNRNTPLIASGTVNEGRSIVDELLTADVFLSRRIAR